MEDNPLIEFLYKTLQPELDKGEKPYKENRLDNMKFYKGDQWRRKQASYKAKSVTNYMSLIVRDEAAIITDNSPAINVIPVDNDADVNTAYILKKTVDHITYQNDLRQILYKAVKLTGIEQISYLFPYWDPNVADGLGDVKIRIERWTSVKRDASGEDNFFKIEKKVTLAEINRLFPDKIDEVKAQVLKSENSSYASNPQKVPMPVQSTDGSVTAIYEGNSLSIGEQHTRVDFDIWWIKDDSVEQIQNPEDPDKYESKTKYPYGRWIYVANKKVILDDKECKIKHFPIVPVILDPDPETDISGVSVIDYTKQQQIDANEVAALTKDWIRTATYLRGRADPASGVDPKKIRNYAGTIVPAAPGQWAWDPPGQMPSELFAQKDRAKADIEYVSAISDMSQGRRPASITSADGLRLLQESARTVLRPKTMLLEGAVKKLGQLLIDYIQTGYDTKRIIRVMGEKLVLNDLEIKDGIEQITNNVNVGCYDVEVEPDSTMPRSDIERFSRLKELAGLGFVDRRAILQASGLPNWQEIEARMAAKEKEFKDQQAQQAQAANQPPVPKQPNVSINYKDAPPDAQTQILGQIGVQTDPQNIMTNQMIQAEQKKSPTAEG